MASNDIKHIKDHRRRSSGALKGSKFARPFTWTSWPCCLSILGKVRKGRSDVHEGDVENPEDL